MPKHTKQQWARFDFTKREVEEALLAKIDSSIFAGSGPIEVITFGNGTAFIRGYVADLDEAPDPQI